MRNGTGTYQTPNGSWTSGAINGSLATLADWQALISDLSNALTQSVSKDGQTVLTGNLNMGGNKLTNMAAGTGVGQTLQWQQLFDQGVEVDLASAATTDIGAQNTNFLRITGTTTITSFGTNFKGPRFLRFEGAVTLTNSSTLVLPGGANITTAAGDVLIAIPGATSGTADKWIVAAYQAAATVTPNAGGFGFRNRLINANPIINQRGYVSGTATTTANQYTLDRWRVVVSGQNVSWTDSGLTRTVTCPAGGWEQVIEDKNIEGGTFVLSWTGTATATVNGTAVVKNGTFTLPANTNATVRFSSGTLSNPQIEAGTIATPFERRDYGRELIMCQRYYFQINAIGSSKEIFTAQAYGSGSVFGKVIDLPITMRASPTVAIVGSLSPTNAAGSQQGSFSTLSFSGFGASSIVAPNLSGSSGLVAGNASVVYLSSGGSISCSSEL